MNVQLWEQSWFRTLWIFGSKGKLANKLRLLVSIAILCGVCLTLVADDLGKTKIAGHSLLKVYKITPNNRTLALPFALFQDRDGIYWVGTALGLFSYDGRRNQWNAMTEHASNQFVDTRCVQRISQGRDGKLWFYSLVLGYVVSYEGRQWEKVETIGGFPNQPTGKLLTSGTGNVWIALQAGLFSIDNGKWSGPVTPPQEIETSFNPYSSNSSRARYPLTKHVTMGIEDRDQNLWMASEKAIIRFNEIDRGWTIYPLPEGLGQISSIYEDSMARIWFGGTNWHASVFNKGKNSWRTYDLGHHWEEKSGQSKPDSLWVNAICQDRVGQMLFATDAGLICFKESKNEWTLFTSENSTLPDSQITAMTLDTEGRVWIGTGKGIIVLDQ